MTRSRARRAAAPLFAALTLLVGCSHIVILHDPLTAAEHNDLGVAYERDGKLGLAAHEYRRALRLDPGLVRARVNLGNLAASDQRWAEAMRCFRRALDESPDDADALNNLAVVLARGLKRFAEAERLAARAVSLGGAHDSLYRATLDEVRAARSMSVRAARRGGR